MNNKLSSRLIARIKKKNANEWKDRQIWVWLMGLNETAKVREQLWRSGEEFIGYD